MADQTNEPAALGESDDTSFDQATIDLINEGRVPADAKHDVKEAGKQIADAIEQAKLARMKGDTKRMGHLFWFVVILVSVVVLAVYAVFVVYMISEWGQIPSEAVIALITGTAVEVIGILAVIARYLYRIDKDEAEKT